jgi:hypothetical protein
MKALIIEQEEFMWVKIILDNFLPGLCNKKSTKICQVDG